VPDVCNSPAAHEAITVGANNEVGSRANFKEKAKKKLTGAAIGAVGKLIGLGGGGGKSEGPPTYKDPVKKKQKTQVRDRKAKRNFLAGGIITPAGLLVSNNIKKSPGKGTFQTIYLQNPSGWRLMPIGLYMYEIWQDWKLSVSWTRDTYVNGEHVKHEEGGWSEQWSVLTKRGEETIYGEVPEVPIWEQLGFNTAVSGARSLGALFPVSAQMLANGRWNLVVHVTDPKKDPVVTVPYIFELRLDEKGRVTTMPTDTTIANNKIDCDKAKAIAATPAASVIAQPDDDQSNTDQRPIQLLKQVVQTLERKPHNFVEQKVDGGTMLSLVAPKDKEGMGASLSLLMSDMPADEYTQVGAVDEPFLGVSSSQANENNKPEFTISFSNGLPLPPLPADSELVLGIVADFPQQIGLETATTDADSQDRTQLEAYSWALKDAGLSTGSYFNGFTNTLSLPPKDPILQADTQENKATQALYKFVRSEYGLDLSASAADSQHTATSPTSYDILQSTTKREWVKYPIFERLYRFEQAPEKYAERFNLVAKLLTLQELKNVRDQLIENGQPISTELTEMIEGLDRQTANAQKQIEQMQAKFEKEYALSELKARAIGDHPFGIEQSYQEYIEQKNKQKQAAESDPMQIISVIDDVGHLQGSGVLSNREAQQVLDNANKQLRSNVQ